MAVSVAMGGAGEPSGAAWRIDIHHHIYPPAFTKANIERIVEDARNMGPEAYLGWSPSISLEDMEKNGVASAITSITSPGIWFGDMPAARRWARDCNEYGARLAADHPGRFGMFAAIPLPDIDGSLREIAHALDVLKLDGIGLLTNYDAKLLGDPAFAPVMDELNRRKAKVFVHPTAQDCCRDLDLTVRPPVLEFPFDTARTITNLLLSGTAARCPDITFIFCHGGGALPVLIERIEAVVAAMPEERRTAWFPQGFAHELAKSYYDVVAITNTAAMSAVRSLVPLDRLLLGSDLPFRKMGITVDGMRRLGFEAAELRAIERENALRLFPRYAGAAG